MDKIPIGLLFITAGLAYGSLAFDNIYNATLGFLLDRHWISPPPAGKLNKNILGRKPTIIIYSFILIIIGLYLIWNRKI